MQEHWAIASTLVESAKYISESQLHIHQISWWKIEQDSLENIETSFDQCWSSWMEKMAAEFLENLYLKLISKPKPNQKKKKDPNQNESTKIDKNERR